MCDARPDKVIYYCISILYYFAWRPSASELKNVVAAVESPTQYSLMTKSPELLAWGPALHLFWSKSVSFKIYSVHIHAKLLQQSNSSTSPTSNCHFLQSLAKKHRSYATPRRYELDSSDIVDGLTVSHPSTSTISSLPISPSLLLSQWIPQASRWETLNWCLAEHLLVSFSKITHSDMTSCFPALPKPPNHQQHNWLTTAHLGAFSLSISNWIFVIIIIIVSLWCGSYRTSLPSRRPPRLSREREGEGKGPTMAEFLCSSRARKGWEANCRMP